MKNNIKIMNVNNFMFNKLFSFLALLLLALLTGTSVSAAALSSQSRADHSNATYEEYVNDMSVKVLGGYVTLKRKYSGAGWELNPNWKNLSFSDLTDQPLDIKQYVSVANGGTGTGIPEGGTAESFVPPIGTIKRGRYEYSPVSKVTRARFVDQYNPSLELLRTATGYRWANREGDWIEYDHLGLATGYGDKNNVRVSFTRDADDRIVAVKDHFGTVVLSYDYSVAGVITVTDHAGRTVVYTGNFQYLPKVTDVRGHDWLYEYQVINNVTVLSKKIDPELRATLIGHELVSGGAVTYSSGGGGDSATWTIEETTDPDTGEVTVREVLATGDSGGITNTIITKDQVMYTSKTYHDLGKEDYRYYYNPETKTYALVSSNSDGMYIDQWFALDGKLKRLASGGLTEFTRAEAQDGSYAITTDVKGRKTRTEYDSFENPTRVVFPDATEARYTYHPKFGFVTKFTDENGDIAQIDYDDKGNAKKITLAVGKPEVRVIEFDYDLFGQPTHIRQVGDLNTLTAETIIAYDNFGNITQVTDPENHITQYQNHDSLGLAHTLIDARTKTWAFEYDAMGNLSKQTTPLGYETVLTYDKVNNLTTILDAELNSSNFTYDARDRLSTTTNALGDSFTINYAIDGQPISAVNEEGHTATFTYDRQRRLKAATNQENLGVQYNYEDEETSALSRLDEIITPNGNIQFTLDKRGRVLTQTNASADASIALPTSYVYDKQFNITKTTDAELHATTNTYNAHDELTQVLNANLELTQLAYDRRGNLKVVTDAKSTTTTYEYDKRDLVIKETKHLGQTLFYAYDGVGNLLRITDSKGQILQFTYDDDGRLITEQHYPNATVADDPLSDASKTVNYTYNEQGYLTGYADGETSAVYTLDKLYRLEATTVNYGTFSKSYSYTYAKDDQIASFTNAEAVVTGYQYDKANRLNLVSISGQGSVAIAAYDGYLPSKIVYPGGVTVTNTYDGVGRVVLEDVKDPAGNPLQITSYAYDKVSNIKTKTGDYGNFSYDYDPVYRLLQANQDSLVQPGSLVNRSYQYDAVGNRTATEIAEESWVYNANHELERINKGGDGSNDVVYGYDANGSTISKTSGTNTETYVYDLENRLREVKQNDVSIALYYYDPFGQRLWKQVNGIKTYFLYTQEGLVAEYDATGALVNSLIYQPDSYWSTAPLGQINAGEAYFYQHDQIGTPNLLTSKTGQVKWQGTADAFGRMQVTTNDLPSNMRFPGQYEDSETGLHYNFRRYYDPSTGRYLQSDPIGLQGGLNRYVYVGGNPIGLIDPQGLNMAGCVAGSWAGPLGCAIGTAVLGGLSLYVLFSVPGDTAVISEAIPRPKDMTRLEERQYDRNCSGVDDPCNALKAAAYTAIQEAIVKMDKMKNDRVLYKYAYDTPNPNVTGTVTMWVTHVDDLRGRLDNIYAMISLGLKMGCDMSEEIVMASVLSVPTKPL